MIKGYGSCFVQPFELTDRESLQFYHHPQLTCCRCPSKVSSKSFVESLLFDEFEEPTMQLLLSMHLQFFEFLKGVLAYCCRRVSFPSVITVLHIFFPIYNALVQVFTADNIIFGEVFTVFFFEGWQLTDHVIRTSFKSYVLVLPELSISCFRLVKEIV